jgi:CheY-like chemotaxis protein
MRVKKPRILIVDDDESIRRVLTEILEGEGYVVDSVGTAGGSHRKNRGEVLQLSLNRY